jgi:hypothetical protein
LGDVRFVWHSQELCIVFSRSINRLHRSSHPDTYADQKRDTKGRYLVNRPVPEQRVDNKTLLGNGFGERRTDSVADEAINDSGNSMWRLEYIQFAAKASRPQ